MSFRRVFACVGISVLLACSGPRSAQRPQEQELELTADYKPSWIQSRPLTESAYVGIGMASKLHQPEEYTAIAKKNALQDLASEISVSVNANSVLYQLEQDNRFQEQFQQSIRTETAMDLEGYRIVGQWENEAQYWVYYRLEKADYLASLERKRQEAGRLALKWLELANEQIAQKARGEALANLIHGFEELEGYLSEEVVIDRNGSRVDVGLQLSQTYLNLMRNLRVSVNPESVDMNQIQAARATDYLRIRVTSEDGTPLNQIPLLIKFDRPGVAAIQVFTRTDGLAEIPLPALPNSRLKMQAEVQINFTQLTEKDASSPVYQLLKRKSFTVKRVPITVRAPIFQVVCENDFENILFERISASFKSRSYAISFEAGRADAIIRWVGKSEKVKTQNGLVGVQLSGTLSVLYKNESLYQTTVGPVMGYGSTHEKAARDANRQAAEILDHEKLRRFFNDLEGY